MVAALIQETLMNRKLHSVLENYMKLTATHSYFKYSEEIEKLVKRLRLYINPMERDCYTDFKGIYIGLKFDLLTQNLDQDFVTVKTVIGHEIGHIRFTNKITWERFTSTATGRYRGLASYSRDLLNIIEDGRIEYWMGMVSHFLKKNFFMLRHRMAKMIEADFETIDTESELTIQMKLITIQNAILYMVCRRIIPKIDNEEIMMYIKQIYPYVIYSRQQKSTENAVKVTEKIMNILSPLIEEFNKESEESKERIPNKFPNRSQGTHNPMEEDDMDEMGKDKKSVNEPSNEELPEEVREQIEKIIEEVSQIMSHPQNEESDSDDEDENDDEQNKNGLVSGGTGSGGVTRLGNCVNDIAALIDKHDAEIKKKNESIVKTLEKEALRPVTEEIIHGYLQSHEKTKKQRIMESNEAKKISELNPNFDENLHKQCIPIFKEKMESYSPVSYASNVGEFQEIINEAAKELKKLSELKRESTLRYQRKGRLDRRRIIQAATFHEEKVFRKKMIDEQQIEMDVMLLVDCSGSNVAEIRNDKNDVTVHRFQMNRIVSIVLHEILAKAKFNHSVWGFEDIGYDQQVFSPMIDFANCSERDSGMRLLDIGAGGGNRDGYAIAYAGNYLEQYGKSNKKLLIVLSDGQPASPGYYGIKAMEDVKAQVGELKKKGIKTIGVFSGEESENEYFKLMYESPIFVNNDSIFDLPKIMKELLVKEFKEHLSTM